MINEVNHNEMNLFAEPKTNPPISALVGNTRRTIRSRNIEAWQPNKFLSAWYKNFHIEISFEDEFLYYSMITHPNGECVVDGYFSGTFDDVLKVCFENILICKTVPIRHTIINYRTTKNILNQQPNPYNKPTNLR